VLSLCDVRAAAARAPIGGGLTLTPKRAASLNLDGFGRHCTARRNFRNAVRHYILDGLEDLDGCSSFQNKGFYRTESVEHAQNA
jgi:hypothetical protein